MTRSEAAAVAFVAALMVLAVVFFIRAAVYVADVVTDPQWTVETTP